VGYFKKIIGGGIRRERGEVFCCENSGTATKSRKRGNEKSVDKEKGVGAKTAGILREKNG